MELTSGNTRLPDWLGRRAHLSPGGLALIADEGQWTFRDLDALAQQVAGRLAELGVRAGDRVALLLSNSPNFVVWVHALPRVGAVLVPLNTRLAPAELAWQLADVGAAALVHDAAHADKALAIARELPGVVRVGLPSDDEPARLVVERPLSSPMAAPMPEGAAQSLRDWVDLGAVHSIIYTSGTTGRPKGAQLTYGNHWWSAIGSCLNLGLMPGDRWLACLPLFHVGGLSILLRSVIYGIPVVLHRRFDPAAANRAIDRQGVTIVSAVANMLARMLDERGGARYPAHLRAVLLGGGPAPLPLLERATAAGMPVLQTYGLTEAASQVATLAPEDALRKLGSAGKPLFPMRVRIVRDGHEVPAGEVGEITVSGPTVTPGYWNRPEATAAALVGGWLRTGDLGYLDPDGYLYVVDRREDLIISGGENVYPAEVEAVLLAHPAVAEAAVVGVPDERWGQVPAAFVALRAGKACTQEELLAFCRERLAGYKVPVRVTFLPELPKGSSGKILRRALREREAQSGDGRGSAGPGR
ncbi:MAG TPA: o-succinylbenzoate--CoA ligase [Limnochordales bacterium]